jgi:hypothetical protein
MDPARAGLAEDAHRMSLVHEQQRSGPRGGRGNGRERRQVAIHAEDRLGHDQPTARRDAFAQQVLEVLHVIVAEPAQARAACLRPAQQAGVAQAVGEDDVPGLCQRAQHAQVGQVAAAEEEGRGVALPGRKFRFQLGMAGESAGDKARRRGACAVAAQVFLRGVQHRRMPRQIEVVVRGEIEQRAAIAAQTPPHAGTLPDCAQEVVSAQILQSGGDPPLGRLGVSAHSSGCRAANSSAIRA